MTTQEYFSARTTLAYFWSLVSAALIGYIVYEYGDAKEILTLIIGLIGGTVIGGIFGYFYGGISTAKTPTSSGVTTADISATITTDTEKKPDETKTS